MRKVQRVGVNRENEKIALKFKKKQRRRRGWNKSLKEYAPRDWLDRFPVERRIAPGDKRRPNHYPCLPA